MPLFSFVLLKLMGDNTGSCRTLMSSGLIFEILQSKSLYKDSKMLCDMCQRYDDADVLANWNAFVNDNGDILEVHNEQNASQNFYNPANMHRREVVMEYIKGLWPKLLRKPSMANSSTSLLPLRHSYFVPGGRFIEMYYWDTYFTSLGLAEDGYTTHILGMLHNFADMIDTYGFIPNGTRTYFTTRSQPPFFANLIELYISVCPGQRDEVLTYMLPRLDKEHLYWTSGDRCPNDTLSCYWDAGTTPRNEAYKEDVADAVRLNIQMSKRPEFYRNCRAGAASGWDFCSRWLVNDVISTTEIYPVDLNALLCNMETKLSGWYADRDTAKSAQYLHCAQHRRQLMDELMWDDVEGFYFDYHYTTETRMSVWSLAGMYPMFLRTTSKEYASRIAKNIRDRFLMDHGLVSTTVTSDLQWDAPSGWAPLQWISIKGLEYYGHNDLAAVIRERWLNIIEEVHEREGRVYEKYNVVTGKPGGGGEYPVQEGFGWTNGTYRALLCDITANEDLENRPQ